MLTLVYGRFTGGGLAEELKRRAKLEEEIRGSEQIREEDVCFFGCRRQ